MDRHRFLFKSLTFLVASVFLINSTAYSAPEIKSALRAPASAVALSENTPANILESLKNSTTRRIALRKDAPHSDPKMVELLRDISSRKLFILELDIGLLEKDRVISYEAMDMIFNLLAAGKKVVIYSNDNGDKSKRFLENSLRKYINKKSRFYDSRGIGFITFKDLYFYADAGRKKFFLDTQLGLYEESVEYTKYLNRQDLAKIRQIIEQRFSAGRQRKTVIYTRKDGFREEFDIYGLSAEEQRAILKKASEIEGQIKSGPVLVKAISEIIKEPRLMVNMAESPSVFYLCYGLLERSYYYKEDPDFKKRQEIIEALSDELKKAGLSIKVEIGGSRAIGIGVFNKTDALNDAQAMFGCRPEETAVIADFSIKNIDMRQLAENANIALINTGDTVVFDRNSLLQLENINSTHGTIFWLTLLHEIASSFNKTDAYIFIDRLVNVYKILLDHPEMASEDIANYLKLTKEQLLEIYSYISRQKAFRRLLIYNSPYRSYTNPLVNMLQYRTRIEKIIKGEPVYPVILEIHLGPYCNSNCAMCFSHGTEYLQAIANKEHKKDRPDIHRELLDLDKIKVLLEDCKLNGVEEIWFSGGKEPLTRGKTAVEAIRMANEMGFKTRVYTNGEFLDTHGAMEVLLDCEQVRISMNAATSETYDKIHFPESLDKNDPFYNVHNRAGKGVFERVKRNVEELVILRNSRRDDANCAKKPKVKIAISQIIQPLNYHEFTQFFEMAYAMGIDSVQMRAESVGMTRPFTEEEKLSIISQKHGLERRRDLREFDGMEFDLRGFNREDLDASKDTEQFLTGMRKASLCRAGAFKRGINPWGIVYNCEYSMHPQNAKDPDYYELGTVIGDLRENSFSQIIDQMGGVFLLNKCPRCQAHEYGMNITLEKLARDYQYGINVSQQPYYHESDYLGNVAVVGLGRWGSDFIIPAVLSVLGKDAKVIGVARSNIEKQKEKFQNESRVTVISNEELDRILSNDNVKTVIVSTSFNSHYEIAKKALLAGKDVFVEKPFTESPEEAEALVEIARQKGLILAVGYEYMHEPSILKLKELINSSFVGTVEQVKMNMLNKIAGRKLDYSSNIIEDLAGHQISMLMALFGEQAVTKLTCIAGTDNAQIGMLYGDKQVSISLDRDHKGPEHIRTIELIGQRGRIILDYSAKDRSVTFKVFDKNGSKIKDSDKNFPLSLKRSQEEKFLESEFDLFFHAVRKRDIPYNSAEATMFIANTIEQLNLLAASNMSPAEAGLSVTEFHWDFDRLINYLWDYRMDEGSLFNYGLEGTQSKKTGRFHSLYVKGRSSKTRSEQKPPKSLYSPFNASQFNFNKIPPEKRHHIMKLDMPTGTVDIFININPIHQGHFLMLLDADAERPQYVETKDILAAAKLLELNKAEDLKIIYNSRGAFASVNHMHFQGFYHRHGQDGNLPIEQAKKRTINKNASLTVSRLIGYPARAVVFESSDPMILALESSAYIKILQDNNIPHNMLMTKGKVYIMPRQFEKEYSLKDEDYLVAAIELAGDFIFMKEKAYTNSSAREIEKAMRETTITANEFHETLKAWKKITETKDKILQDHENIERYTKDLTLSEFKALLISLGLGEKSVAGKFVTYSGSSGGGKSSIWDLIIQSNRDIFKKVLLYTTRPRRFKTFTLSDGQTYEKLKSFMESSLEAEDFLNSIADEELGMELKGILRPLFDVSVYGKVVSKGDLLELEGDCIHVYNEFDGVHYYFVSRDTLEKMAEEGNVITMKVKESLQGLPIDVLKGAKFTPYIFMLESDKGLLFEFFKDKNRDKLKEAGIDTESLDISSFFVLPMDIEELKERFNTTSFSGVIRGLKSLLVWENTEEREHITENQIESLVLKMRNAGIAKLIERLSAQDIKKVLSVISGNGDNFDQTEKIHADSFDSFLRSNQVDELREKGYIRDTAEDLLSKRSYLSQADICMLSRISYIVTFEMTRRLKKRSNDNNTAFRYDGKFIERIADALEENFFAVLNTERLIKAIIINKWKDDGVPDIAVDLFLRDVYLEIAKNLVNEDSIKAGEIKAPLTVNDRERAQKTSSSGIMFNLQSKHVNMVLLQDSVSEIAQSVSEEIKEQFGYDFKVSANIIGSGRYAQTYGMIDRAILSDIDILVRIETDDEVWRSIQFDHAGNNIRKRERVVAPDEYMMRSVMERELEDYFHSRLTAEIEKNDNISISAVYHVFDWQPGSFHIILNMEKDNRKFAIESLRGIRSRINERGLRKDGTFYRVTNDRGDTITFDRDLYLAKTILQLNFYLEDKTKYDVVLDDFIHALKSSSFDQFNKYYMQSYLSLRTLLDEVLDSQYNLAASYGLLDRVYERIVSPISFAICVYDVIIESEDRFAKGRVAKIDPEKIALMIWHEPEAVNYDFSVYANTPAIAKERNRPFREFPGKTMQSFVDSYNNGTLPEEFSKKGLVFAVNGHQGNFWDPNSLVIINGELIYKKSAGTKQSKHEPLNDKYSFVIFDSGEHRVRDIRIINDKPCEDISDIKYALAGPVLIRNGQELYHTLEKAKELDPVIKAQQTNWDVATRTMAMSAIGIAGDGTIIQVSLAGKPDKEIGEALVSDVVDILKYHNVVDAILLGTSQDVQQYIAGQESILISKPRKDSLTGQYYDTIGGRPLSTIICGYKAAKASSSGGNLVSGIVDFRKNLHTDKARLANHIQAEFAEEQEKVIVVYSDVLEESAGARQFIMELRSNGNRKPYLIITDNTVTEATKHIYIEALGLHLTDFEEVLCGDGVSVLANQLINILRGIDVIRLFAIGDKNVLNPWRQHSITVLALLFDKDISGGLGTGTYIEIKDGNIAKRIEEKARYKYIVNIAA
jgi:predicted dehydrogenase/MoaA/NifB/PqqE/SkfB family radical SAM enzyme/guanylate kinase